MEEVKTIVDSHTLLQIGQKSILYLKNIFKTQKRLQSQIDAQQQQLDTILQMLNKPVETEIEIATTTKGKEKQNDDFYQVSIQMLV